MGTKQFVLLVLACIMTVDSILRMFRTTLNLGTFLMYSITAALWIYALFFRQIDAFCAHGFGRALKYLFFAGCLFAAGMMTFLAAYGLRQTTNGHERALIVLGASVRGSTVSGVLARRLDAACAYYESNPDVLIVVSGGQGPDETMPEAEAMAAYLESKGVPSENILCEKNSASTQENFEMSLQLLEAHGISRGDEIAYVTNVFHVYRAGVYAQMAGFENIRSIPAPTGLGILLQCYLRETFGVLYLWVFVR